jgi:DNA mismatch endonuclease, patch repair protein
LLKGVWMPFRHQMTKTTKVSPKSLRSAIMRAVKGRDTGPELAVAGILKSLELRVRRNVKFLPGTPDFANKTAKLAIFVHGCFWHGHGCARGARTPKTNAAYWTAKIARNKARDARVRRALWALGYRVLTVWECRLKRPAAVAARIEKFAPERKRGPGNSA